MLLKDTKGWCYTRVYYSCTQSNKEKVKGNVE